MDDFDLFESYEEWNEEEWLEYENNLKEYGKTLEDPLFG